MDCIVNNWVNLDCASEDFMDSTGIYTYTYAGDDIDSLVFLLLALPTDLFLFSIFKAIPLRRRLSSGGRVPTSMVWINVVGGWVSRVHACIKMVCWW